MADVLDFPEIWQEMKGAMYGGKLKLSKQGIMFKNNKTGLVEQVHPEDLKESKWMRVARGYELKLLLKNGSIQRYDGFKDSDRERIAEFIKSKFDIDLKDNEMCVKGWNWGEAVFYGSELDFKIGSKSAFHIPLSNVSHSTTTKNEVILEFHQNDDAHVSLMEMRFFVPPSEANKDKLETFHENVMAKADIIQATGDAITSLEQIPCLTPRGRYDIKIFPTFLQLHGKTFDYKIPYSSVLRLFLLPHKDQRQMLFVMSLDPPIVQGQTRYHFLILSFEKEEMLTVNLNLSEEELEGKYEGKLQQEMNGPLFEIVSRLMKALVARKITVPGSFKDSKHHQAITCSYKSNSGYLYPLERGFMFVHKPPIHIRFDEVACVNFARGTTSSRYFDFEIETRNSEVYVFSSIEKEDYTPLFDFVSNKKLRVKNRGKKNEKVSMNYDELFDSDDEGKHDAYLEQMKAEGREKQDVDDTSDSSSDEDFNPGESDSEVDEEYDSNAEPSFSSDSDYNPEEAARNQKQKSGDDESAAGSSHDGASSNDEEKKEKEEMERKRKRKEKESKPQKRTKTVKTKKKKKDKDPDKPKRPSTAFMLFLNAQRPKIKEKYPDIPVSEVAKKGGEMWQALEDQSEWKEQAEKAKEKYKEAMEEYKLTHKDSPKEERPKKPKKASKSESISPSSISPKKDFKSKEYISSEDSSDDEKKDKKKKSVTAKKEPSSPVSVKEEEKEDDSEEEHKEESEEEKAESEKAEEDEEADDEGDDDDE